MNPLQVMFIIVCLYCGALTLSCKAKPLPNVYGAELIKVIDADTIKVRLLLYPGLYQTVNLRIAGIDTPESRRGVKNGQRIRECEIILGHQASDYARNLLHHAQQLQVRNIDPSLTKYASRINGELWLIDGDSPMNYGAHLIEQGLAVPYTGGARQPWECKKVTPLP
ncbi:thermonuclease family protein [uncultured Shewanella sp.]|uniref:thermonuclease family protein n=1 Tax=uncultured Shewanella sp. TaxID=173975 RepID=UPI002605E424|nr:thermonuclease family protein [uncultured Shewanella sp.]